MAKYLDSNGLTTLWNKIKSYVNEHGGGTAPSDLADYIVESGTSGIWTYEKWNSGVAKCHGKQSYSTLKASSPWTSTNTNIYYGTITSGIAFPSGLFTEAPEIYMFLRVAGGRFWLSQVNDATASSTGTIYNLAPQQYTSNSGGVLSIRAIGTWK